MLSILAVMFIASAVPTHGVTPPAPAISITETAIPTANSGAAFIVSVNRASARCRAWFSEVKAERVGCLDRFGNTIERALPGSAGLVIDSTGDVWIGQPSSHRIAKLSSDDRLSEHALSTTSILPVDLSSTGKDGVWFTTAPKLGLAALSESGSFKYLDDGNDMAPIRLAQSAGYTWFTTTNGFQIGRIGPDNRVALFSILEPSLCDRPHCLHTESDSKTTSLQVPGFSQLSRLLGLDVGATLRGISAASDGSAWFTTWNAPVAGGAAIGHITVDGLITYFPTPTLRSYPAGIASCGDEVWFTEYGSAKIGVVDQRRITEWSTPTKKSGPTSIACDREGVLFIESAANKIGGATQLHPSAVPDTAPGTSGQ